jgi:hypothetical protein
MAATNFVSPGTYVREIDRSLYVSALAGTSIGMVGTSTWGPVNSAREVTNHNQLFTEYGPLSGLAANGKTPKHPMMYAAARYLRKGRRARLVRITDGDEKTATYRALDNTGKIALKFKALYPGTRGNRLRLEIDDAKNKPVGTDFKRISVIDENPNDGTQVTLEAFDRLSGDYENLYDNYYDQIFNGASNNFPGSEYVRIEDVPPSVATFNPASNNPPVTAPATLTPVYSASGKLTGNKPYYVAYTWYSDSGESLASATASVTLTQTQYTAEVVDAEDGTTGSTGTLANTPVLPGSVTITSTLGAITDNGLGTGWIRVSTGAAVVGSLNYSSGVFSVTWWANTAGSGNVTATYKKGGNALTFVVPSKSGVTQTSGSVPAAGVMIYIGETSTDLRYAASNVASSGGPTTVTVTKVGPNLDPANSSTGAPYALVGGLDGDVAVSASDIRGTRPGSGSQLATGLKIFEDQDGQDITLLAVPGVSDAAVVGDVISVCELRSDCLGIVDPPFGLDVDNVIKYHNGDSLVGNVTVDYGTAEDTATTVALDSSYGALYYPWLKIRDDDNSVEIWIPPSAGATEVIANNDYVAEPWFAAAGPNRGTLFDILDLELRTTQGERDSLYSGGNAVNPIVAFAGQGVQVYGQRTLQRKPTALDRINVRRLLIFLRKAIGEAVRALVFEQNDATLWREFTGVVRPILQSVKTRRGLRDFRVQMDSTTNTDAVIENNQAVGRIYLKPTKTAEIIIVEFVVTAQGTTFSETVTAGNF